jgi:hypothetical protein
MSPRLEVGSKSDQPGCSLESREITRCGGNRSAISLIRDFSSQPRQPPSQQLSPITPYCIRLSQGSMGIQLRLWQRWPTVSNWASSPNYRGTSIFHCKCLDSVFQCAFRQARKCQRKMTEPLLTWIEKEISVTDRRVAGGYLLTLVQSRSCCCSK